MVFATYERLNRNTNDNDLFCYVFRDTSNVFYYADFLSIAENPSVDERNPSLSIAPGGYGIVLYEVDGDLKYIFSTNYFAPYSSYDFPYNTADSTEKVPSTNWWYTPPFYRGFNTIFLRNASLYFTQATCIGSSINWNEPVLVSDEWRVATHIGNLGNYNYYPRISNRGGHSAPVVVWHCDFSHFLWPILRYDSTYILVDNMHAVGVREISNRAKVLNFSVSTPSRDKITLQFKGPITENAEGNLISVNGQVLSNFEIPAGSKEYEIKTSNLPVGVYFIQISVKTEAETKKIIITQ